MCNVDKIIASLVLFFFEEKDTSFLCEKCLFFFNAQRKEFLSVVFLFAFPMFFFELYEHINIIHISDM